VDYVQTLMHNESLASLISENSMGCLLILRFLYYRLLSLELVKTNLLLVKSDEVMLHSFYIIAEDTNLREEAGNIYVI
jgi:hypothetical protein